MREVTVPVDLVSEVKNIMGILSTRQLVYVIVGGLISYQWIFYFPSPLTGSYRYMLNAVIIAPFFIGMMMLSFIYLPSKDMYLDKLLWYWWRSRRQHGVWYYHHRPVSTRFSTGEEGDGIDGNCGMGTGDYDDYHRLYGLPVQ